MSGNIKHDESEQRQARPPFGAMPTEPPEDGHRTLCLSRELGGRLLRLFDFLGAFCVLHDQLGDLRNDTLGDVVTQVGDRNET